MIWSVVSKEEMEGFGTNPVFRFYREALGKDNIRLAVVETHDALDFVGSDDVVLLRTADKNLISTIESKGIKSTAEKYKLYELTQNKEAISRFLFERGINVPKQYSLDEIEDGKVYFVKPKFGSDSKCITQKSICHSKEEVGAQISKIRAQLNQESVIEEFIDGVDCTVVCFSNFWGIKTYATMVECEETSGIQTVDCKVGCTGFFSPIYGVERLRIESTAKDVCLCLNLEHHARIDFRRSKDGSYYVIDVNSIPGLGPLGYLARCLLISEHISYVNTIRMVIDSAS